MDGQVLNPETDKVEIVPGCLMEDKQGKKFWVSSNALLAEYRKAVAASNTLPKPANAYANVVSALVASWVEAGNEKPDNGTSLIEYISQRGFEKKL